jgi:hypothetical protein
VQVQVTSSMLGLRRKQQQVWQSRMALSRLRSLKQQQVHKWLPRLLQPLQQGLILVQVLLRTLPP